MTREEAVNWLINIMSDIGKSQHRDLWHYEQALAEIKKMLEEEQHWIPWNTGNLPKESGTYTITAYDGVTKRVTYAKYQKQLKRWELTGARAYWRVLAWMPSPEPWEGDAE